VSTGIRANDKSLKTSLDNDAPVSNGNIHSVQFYEDDSQLIEDLTEYIRAALAAGDSAIVVATEAHRRGLADRLTGRGFDLALASSEGRFVSLDAAHTLSQLMVNDRLEPTRFA